MFKKDLNSNTIDTYNTLVNTNTASNTGLSSASSSSSSTPISNAGNINQTLSPQNIAPTSTTPPSAASSSSTSTSNLAILQRSSNIQLSNAANNWSNAANSNSTGYVEEY